MRLFTCLFVLGFALEAQSSQYLAYWLEVQRYLELSDEQLSAILKLSEVETSPDWAQVERMKAEIGEETARSPLRPAELGRLHVGWEMFRRQLREQESQRNAAARSLLNETQLMKMRALDVLSKRVSVLQKATWIGLSPIDCDAPESAGDVRCELPYIPSVGRIPNWVGRPEIIQIGNPFETIYPRIRTYLDLSAPQQAQMLENERQYYSLPVIDRMRIVAEELRQEMTREVLDPLAIGPRYAEVEALRRKLSDDARKLVTANTGLLSELQRTKVNALAEALRLQPTVAEARQLSFLGSRCREIYSAFTDEDFPFARHEIVAYLGDCPDRGALEELPH